MASTGAKEHFDEDAKVDQDADAVARWLGECGPAVVYTGAGLSTSSGIRDFRGPQGKWTLRKQGKVVPREFKPCLPCPSEGHMAIKALAERGHIEAVISQNTDGLHLRSGLDPEKLAEVHGNTNKEICNGCGAVYMRAFRCREAKKAHDHRTSRKCCYCRATLSDVIVNFGESLPDRDISKGFSNSESARVALALGSSLTVSPAADMPLAAKVAGAKFAIVNLQRTPLDSRADVVTHASVDAFLGKLCEKLGVGVDDYLFSRPIEVRIVSDEKKHRRKESSPTRTPSSSKGQHSLTFRGALREVEYTAKRSSGSTDGRKAAMKGNDLVRLELRAPESEASDKALSAMLRRATFVPKTTEKQYGTDGADGWAVRVGYQEVVSQQVQVKLSTKLCPPEAGGEGDTTACEFTASLAKGANDVIARDCWEISFRRRHVAWHASRIPLEEGARWRSEVIVPPRNRQTSPFS